MGTKSVQTNSLPILNSGSYTNGSSCGDINVLTTEHQPANTNDADVLQIPITIQENSVIDGAKEILKIIRPTWSADCIKFKLFTDGITNKLVGCFNTASSKSLSSAVKENGSPDKNSLASDVVLVRVYGNKTDLLIDRKAETKNIKLLHHYGFAPSLFATFCNGLAYEYVPGCTLTPDTVVLPQVWQLVARRMADMHKVEYNAGEVKTPALWQKLNKFFDLVPDVFSNAETQERISAIFPPIGQLRQEFNDLYKRLRKLNSPVVFSHNDLLLGNIIYTESADRVTFIDYEYAANNYQAFDIGNHFTEFAGIDEIDYSLYPSQEFQFKWLRVYLQAYRSCDEISDDDVYRLYVQVNQFALASHIFWVVWAMIQVQHSSIDFDFVKFASIRYQEYCEKKDAFLSLELPLE